MNQLSQFLKTSSTGFGPAQLVLALVHLSTQLATKSCSSFGKPVQPVLAPVHPPTQPATEPKNSLVETSSAGFKTGSASFRAKKSNSHQLLGAPLYTPFPLSLHSLLPIHEFLVDQHSNKSIYLTLTPQITSPSIIWRTLGVR
jgi:hypothetical protein